VGIHALVIKAWHRPKRRALNSFTIFWSVFKTLGSIVCSLKVKSCTQSYSCPWLNLFAVCQGENKASTSIEGLSSEYNNIVYIVQYLRFVRVVCKFSERPIVTFTFRGNYLFSCENHLNYILYGAVRIPRNVKLYIVGSKLWPIAWIWCQAD
jgi:hypothetical protein